jgi:hypothetical protein
MARVSWLGYVGVYVHDIERSRAFYRDILGLSVSDESAGSGAVFLTSKERTEEHHELLLVPGREVNWAIATRCQPGRDIAIVANVRGSDLDPSAKEDGCTGKRSVDPTAKPSLAEYRPRNHVPRDVLRQINLDDFFTSSRG